MIIGIGLLVIGGGITFILYCTCVAASTCDDEYNNRFSDEIEI